MLAQLNYSMRIQVQADIDSAWFEKTGVFKVCRPTLQPNVTGGAEGGWW